MRKVKEPVVIYTHLITLTTPQLHHKHHLPTLTTWTWPDLEPKDQQSDDFGQITTIWSMAVDRAGREWEIGRASWRERV